MTDHRTDLTQLIHRLYATLDEARFDDLHTVFTPDATVRTAGGLAQGRDAVIAQATRTHATERTQHLVTNTLIDLDGDHATIRADLLVTFTHHPAPGARHIPEPRFTLGERLTYHATRTPDGWRLSHLHATPIWATGERN